MSAGGAYIGCVTPVHTSGERLERDSAGFHRKQREK
jgi:hypothetical protein